jgi:hypothetical protein
VYSFRILFIGDMTPYLTTAVRRDAFLELGLPVETIDPTSIVRSPGRLAWALTYRTLLTPGVFELNRRILEQTRRFRPDVIWIEKGSFVFPRTMRRLHRESGGILVYHNTDDWKFKGFVKNLHWRFLRRSLKLYDIHITSNLYNVKEFRDTGLPVVVHMELAANPALSDPGFIAENERKKLGAPVGFIGHWEPMTERSLLHLVHNGVGLKIYGGGWEDAQTSKELHRVVQNRFVWGPEYARAVSSFDVNLGIVSKWNRNHTATRTFQIPALGAFLLHERNEVVTRYFKEGVEAEFFGSDEELLSKCRHYLENPEDRRRIAEAGRRRCIESGYFETDRVREILPILDSRLHASQQGTRPKVI